MTDVVIRHRGTPAVARPRPSPVTPVSRRRVLLAAAAIALVVGGAVRAVSSLHDSGAAPRMLALTIGLLVVPLVASPIEWFVHRFVYHEAVIRPLAAIFTVHTVHHHGYRVRALAVGNSQVAKMVLARTVVETMVGLWRRQIAN